MSVPERLSARIGSHLRSRGVTADDPVGLVMEPSVGLVSGVWEIARSGGAYLPLAPSDGRLAHMLADGGARVVLAAAEDLGRLAAACAALDQQVA